MIQHLLRILIHNNSSSEGGVPSACFIRFRKSETKKELEEEVKDYLQLFVENFTNGIDAIEF